jgi:predicted PurR-regulated permease PerM
MMNRPAALLAANVAFLATAVTAVVASSIAPLVASSGFATVAKSIVSAIAPVCIIGTIVAGCGVFSAFIAVVVIIVVIGLCTLGTAAYVVANSVSQVGRDFLESPAGRISTVTHASTLWQAEISWPANVPLLLL